MTIIIDQQLEAAHQVVARNKADKVLGVRPVQQSLLDGGDLVLGPTAAPTQERVRLPTSFYLQGQRYYQQFRRCGRAGCRCVNDDERHGPYWYRRDNATGKREYLGADLPSAVVAAYVSCKLSRRSIQADIGELRSRLAALQKLADAESLSSVNQQLLREMGYNDCLVGGDV